MNKKSTHILWVVSLMILIGVFFRYCSSPSKETVLIPDEKGLRDRLDSEESLPSHARARKSNPVASFTDSFKTPITLFGKVVDQHGDPVPGATVKLYPLDSPWEEDSGSKVTMASDANGAFSVKDLRGFSIGVQVEKEGYIYLPPLGGPASSANISYANGASGGKRFSNPKTPLVMNLQKVGPIEPLVHVKEKRWRLPIDGSILRVALDTEDGKGMHQIEFRLWSDNHVRDEAGRGYALFDWTFEARIPGGGFLWTGADLDTEPPKEGYKESIRYEYPDTLPIDKWTVFQQAQYFVKFADNTYGKIRIGVDAGSDRSPLSMTSWLNPRSGSRNLASPYMGRAGVRGKDPEKEHLGN